MKNLQYIEHIFNNIKQKSITPVRGEYVPHRKINQDQKYLVKFLNQKYPDLNIKVVRIPWSKWQMMFQWDFRIGAEVFSDLNFSDIQKEYIEYCESKSKKSLFSIITSLFSRIEYLNNA